MPGALGQAGPGQRAGGHVQAALLLAQFPDLHMTVEAIVAEEDMVAVQLLSEGTNWGRSTG